jgi:hypothetical protein
MQWVGTEQLPHLEKIQRALRLRGTVELQLRDGRLVTGKVEEISTGSNVHEVKPPNAFYGTVEIETEEGARETVDFIEIDRVGVPAPKLLVRTR